MLYVLHCENPPDISRGGQRLAKKQRINWFLIHDSKQLMKKVFLDSLIRTSDFEKLFLDSLVRISDSKFLFLDSLIRISQSKKLFLGSLIRINFEKKLFLDSLIQNNFSKVLILGSFFETETVKLNHLFRTNYFFANLLWWPSLQSVITSKQ